MKHEVLGPAIIKVNGVSLVLDDLLAEIEDVESEWNQSSISSNKIIDHNIRKSFSMDISPSYSKSSIFFDFAKEIWEVADFYGKMFDVGFSEMEPIQLLKYEKDIGHYTFHSDDGPGQDRVFSIVLYLNTVDVGGETEFEHFKISNKPIKNTCIVFPSNFAYKHRALPPTSSEKIAVVTWFKK